MIRRISLLLMIMFGMLGLVGCDKDDDIIWDIAPAEIIIHLQDRNGNDLLDPTFEGNLVGEPMEVVWDGKSYPAIWTEEEYKNDEFGTRAIISIFRGLLWTGIWDYKPGYRYALQFGEFDGEENQHIKITFQYEKINTVFEIELIHTIKWKHSRPEITNTIIYQGKKIDGNIVSIVI